nr:retinol dehydrogenase 12-like isoform X2 [Onthophagus taurus]
MKSNCLMLGKTVLITGGNSGLGYQTALILAGRGAKIIIADKNDSTQSKNRIIQETKNPNVKSKMLDLSSFESIRIFAKEIIEEEDTLDVLINNAGLGYSGLKTIDNLPELMQVNHLGSFLLTHLLLDLLKKSAPSRIIFVSSLMAFINNLTIKNIDKVLSPLSLSYGNSKLCNIITANVFAEKLKGTGVTSNSVHPGLVNTPIFRNAHQDLPKSSLDAFYVFLKLFGKSVFEGAQTNIHCAISKSLEKVSGKFFVDCTPFFLPFKAKNKLFVQEIWRKSEELVGLKDEEKL